MNRRSFLRLVGLGGAAASLPLPAPPSPAAALPVSAPFATYEWKSIVVPIWCEGVAMAPDGGWRKFVSEGDGRWRAA